jgi:hypothetical protein
VQIATKPNTSTFRASTGTTLLDNLCLDKELTSLTTNRTKQNGEFAYIENMTCTDKVFRISSPVSMLVLACSALAVLIMNGFDNYQIKQLRAFFQHQG